MNRIDIQPTMLRWACERAGYSQSQVASRIRQFPAWLSGAKKPTLKQLEQLAQVTHTPLGYFFLPAPPEEPLPITDFRTLPGAAGRRPSPDLLDTLYLMQRRQAWLREALIESDAEPHDFVGSAQLVDPPEGIGREMRRALGLADGWGRRVPNWQAAVGKLRQAIEQLGVMAVINGVVNNNNHRKLDVQEFRGFALTDPYAPLIFVNGGDAKSAQMFTLAHELAHIWLGSEGLSGFDALFPGGTKVEEWCNRAAAELLVPARELRDQWPQARRASRPFDLLARAFKVSPVVAARRVLDVGLIGREAFFEFYGEYVARERGEGAKGGGGDFYNNQSARVGALFTTHVARAALEGRLGFQDMPMT